MTEDKILHYYRKTEASHLLLPRIREALQSGENGTVIESVEAEVCFNVQVKEPLNDNARQTLEWLLAETFEPEGSLQFEQPHLQAPENDKDWLVEFGPRMTFTTAFSSNAVSICQACQLTTVQRVELSRRYLFHCNAALGQADKSVISLELHDRMTEQEYDALTPRSSFVDPDAPQPKPVTTIPILEEGRAALEKVNTEMGLGFDDFDLDYYTTIFKEKLGRNPTDVECFDMGQSNSEHSRHWFFGGKLVLNGKEQPHTLFQMVKATISSDKAKSNSVIAFHDNSSAIAGFDCPAVLCPTRVDTASRMVCSAKQLHPILTAETHNFPTGVAPFAGAETGTGGRLRDVMATGRGAYPIAGVAAYCVGNLQMPGYELPWEQDCADFVYPNNLASPLQILVEASDGASDYGNKYGEPVICGFCRTFGQRLPSVEAEAKGERYEWVKPIMFSAGIGNLDGRHVTKGSAEPNMEVVKLGGPAYRIGMGGGAASSRVSSSGLAALDFNAVQRGDAEMENRLNRLMRACHDLGEDNPIVSVHDQGAGGNGNVLKEIVEPGGANYDIRRVLTGDETLSVLELWGAEYQENNAILIESKSRELLEAISQREHCPIRILGQVTGDGRVVVRDSDAEASSSSAREEKTPVDLPLELVLGKMPQKTFVDSAVIRSTQPLAFPDGRTPTVMESLDRVLRLVSVGSKRFLVNKVDRSVTGLIAQQQCVGPLQLPLANVGVTATSYYDKTGTAVACGEQPIKGMLNAACMARLTVAEALTNLVWAKMTSLDHVKASGNWMYAAKLAGEGCQMYQACEALRDSLLTLGVAIDGGKDSLSMAAQCGDELVKAPGELTLTCYVTCPDIALTVTPDLKPSTDETRLIYVDLSGGDNCNRLGGSALAQAYNQIGNDCPDVHDFGLLKSCIDVTQGLMQQRLILAGHDRSDGGLIVTLLEMAFAGNCGLNVQLPQQSGSALERLFSEEAGIVLQVAASQAEAVLKAYTEAGVSSALDIGSAVFDASDTTSGKYENPSMVIISVGEEVVLNERMAQLRDIWEATSFALEMRQRNPACVVQEQEGLQHRRTPAWHLTFTPTHTSDDLLQLPPEQKHCVAVLRQEGSNGDREMLAALYAAGLDVWDVTMHDLMQGKVRLEQFRGVVFCGGFSFADVLDSGKGWAGVILHNPALLEQFQDFYKRTDTFSLGVCNGCQLMALLGWVPCKVGELQANRQPRLLHNTSGKFESRFVNVSIPLNHKAVLLQGGMAGSTLGVWVAHGEGRFFFPDQTVLNETVLPQGLAPLVYVDDGAGMEPTEAYPFNPNGSPAGIAALCSPDGRHLAMMPHPERVFTTWQWPYRPDSWQRHTASPWMQMFQNARHFCDQTKAAGS